MEPQALFIAGELSACAEQLNQAPASVGDRAFAARAYMRLGRHEDALKVLATIRPPDPAGAAYTKALEAQCHAARGSADRARHALAHVGSAPYRDDIDFEVAFAWSLIAWVEGDADAMDGALRVSPASVVLRGRWLYARSWLAALRTDYRQQCELLYRAVDHLASVPTAADVSLLAMATHSLVHLLREISPPDIFERVAEIAKAIPWTKDLETHRLLTLRALAWAYGLRGHYDQAMEHAYDARDAALSSMWIAGCYADQAYLARMAGHDAFARALLRHAVNRAQCADWTGCGEERAAILNLVELVADEDVPTAKGLWSLYERVASDFAPTLGFARGDRMLAMESYAHGTLLAASGLQVDGVRQLRKAYTIFESIGYAWRAAASALRLHAVTQDDTWLQRAAEAVQGFSESSVAQHIAARSAHLGDVRIAGLTPAQRRVCELICEGLTDKAIADRLSVSPQTVKNHAVRVREAFGVRSRSAVIAAIRAPAS